MNKCEIKDKKLVVYVDPARIPTTDFAQKHLQKCLQEYCLATFNGDMASTIEKIIKIGEFCLVFTPSDYIALADMLDSYLNYDLEQARTICNWIHNNVREPDDTTDWATVYLEILEGANVK